LARDSPKSHYPQIPPSLAMALCDEANASRTDTWEKEKARLERAHKRLIRQKVADGKGGKKGSVSAQAMTALLHGLDAGPVLPPRPAVLDMPLFLHGEPPATKAALAAALAAGRITEMDPHKCVLVWERGGQLFFCGKTVGKHIYIYLHNSQKKKKKKKKKKKIQPHSKQKPRAGAPPGAAANASKAALGDPPDIAWMQSTLDKLRRGETDRPGSAARKPAAKPSRGAAAGARRDSGDDEDDSSVNGDGDAAGTQHRPGIHNSGSSHASRARRRRQGPNGRHPTNLSAHTLSLLDKYRADPELFRGLGSEIKARRREKRGARIPTHILRAKKFWCCSFSGDFLGGFVFFYIC
jgi:hypothetical protein